MGGLALLDPVGDSDGFHPVLDTLVEVEDGDLVGLCADGDERTLEEEAAVRMSHVVGGAVLQMEVRRQLTVGDVLGQLAKFVAPRGVVQCRVQ